MKLDPDIDKELEAKKKRLRGELWQRPEGAAQPEALPALAEDPNPPAHSIPVAPPVPSAATPSRKPKNAPSIPEEGILALTARMVAQEQLLLRVLDVVSKAQDAPHETGVDAWLASVTANAGMDGERSTYSIRLSEKNRQGLELAMEHRGHRTIADALDEALCVGLQGVMRLPSKRGYGNRRGRKKKA